ATNLVTAAGYAQLGAMPMVMITGQKPIRNNKQALFQIIDVVDMMRPLTKFTESIPHGDAIPSRVREAFRQAEEERPGACHLELPEDVAQDHFTMPVVEASYTRRPIAEDKAINKALAAMRAARKPLLLIGAGANRKLTRQMLAQFILELGAPAVAPPTGQGVVDESSEDVLGNAALSSGDFVHRALDKADLVLNIGYDPVENPPFFMRPGGAEVIHVNFNSARVEPVYFPQIELVGDISNTLWRLQDQIEPQPHWNFEPFHAIRRALDAHISELEADDRFPMLPQRLVYEVRNVMRGEDNIA